MVEQVGTGQVFVHGRGRGRCQPTQDFGGESTFAKMVEATLANPRSWIGDGKVAFPASRLRRSDLRISLTSSGTARGCAGIESNWKPTATTRPDQRVVLNEGPLECAGRIRIRAMTCCIGIILINHEVGHGIGYEHHLPVSA